MSKISCKIRNATIDDFEQIFTLLVSLYEKNSITKNKTLSLFKAELQNKESSQIVAVHDGKIVGFASSTNRIDYQSQGMISLLTCLIVDEKSRGLGIGKKLLSSIETLCKKKKSKELQFSSTFRRTQSHRFYESQGYTKTAYYFWKTL